MAQQQDLELLRATRPRQQPHQREQIPPHEIHESPEQAASLTTARISNLTSRTRTESRDEFANPTRLIDTVKTCRRCGAEGSDGSCRQPPRTSQACGYTSTWSAIVNATRSCSTLASSTLSSSSEAASGSRKTRAPCSSITSSSSAGSGTTLSWKFACVPARSATIRKPLVSLSEEETMLFTASTALSVSASDALTSFLVGSGRKQF